MTFKKAVPSKLVRKFAKFGIDSVESLLQQFDSLTQSKGFGGVFEAELIRFMKAENIQIPKTAKAAVIASIPQQIAEILSFGYKEFIYPVTGRLDAAFKKLSITDLSSLLSKLGDLNNELSTKKATQSDFQTWLADTVAFCRDTGAPIHGKDYLEIASDYLDAFSRNLDDSQKYIFKNLVLDNKKSCNDVAIFQNVSRQYVHATLQTIRTNAICYLLGGTIENLPKVDLVLAKMLYRLNRAVRQNKLLSAADTAQVLHSDSSRNNNKILEKLGDILGFYVFEFKKGDIPFCVNNDILQVNIRELVGAIRETLKESVYPMGSDDIVIDVRKKIGKKADKDLILYILDHYSCVEKTDGLYYIKLSQLSTVADMAVRVLYNAQKEMKFQEIAREINRICIAEGGKARDNIKAANFKQNSDLIAQGKSGYWTLKGKITQAEDALPLKQQVIRLLQAQGKPMAIDAIRSALSNVDHYAKNTLTIILNGSDFARLKNKQVILSAWKNLYQQDLKPKKKRVRKASINPDDLTYVKICNSIKQMFAIQGTTQLKLADIKAQLGKSGFKSVTIYAAIRSDISFRKEKDGRNLILHYNGTEKK